MIDGDLLLRFALALIAVLALIAGLAWVARRYGPRAGLGFAVGKERRLAVIEATPIDAKSRLILLRRDRIEHLVLVGPSGATVIERGIEASGDPTRLRPLERAAS